MPKKFPFYQQLDATDCGAACLRMIARFYGRFYSLDYLRSLTYIDREGVSFMGISDAAEEIGFHTLGAKINYEQLLDQAPLPLIAHWRQNHFVVVYKANKKYVWVADPSAKLIKYTVAEFLEGWTGSTRDGQQIGLVLLFETTPDFFERDGDKQSKGGFSYLYGYLRNFKGLVSQMVLGLVIVSVLQLIFPFLIQSLVDVGVRNQNLGFITLILLAQLVLFLSQMAVEFIRSWILMYFGTRVNVNMISDFLVKLMKLPLRFFDTKTTGDLLQRIYDNERIERLLTSDAMFTMFSLINLFIFGLVLAFFNATIFWIFLVGSVAYFAWVILFLNKRRELDYKRFDQLAENQGRLIQLIGGVKEIKLHNAEKQKRWAWERVQAKLYRISTKALRFDQFQRAGARFINEFKNILITFFAARAVIQGEMTLGMMLAVQYMIGQLNGPVEQFVSFIRAAQDAKLSLERMNEIHTRDNEEGVEGKVTMLPERADLKLEETSFQYGGPHSPVILKNVNLTIPVGKKTAIVGTSGSGKTTILKLLLNFYKPTQGVVRLGEVSLFNLQNRVWRDKCGVVMQDGFIFSESIAHNIALGDEIVDKKKLLHAVKIANIQSYIESLPLGYNTKVGEDGIGLSQGEKQRLLIARAVYKNPDYIFFDEATNALDAYNEMVIMDNLETFFENKTVVIVAHRLSTVKSADKIVVLEKGELIEEGTHQELTALKGHYYHLVKNQLELGS